MQKYVFHSVTERNSAARPRTRRRDTAISKPKLKRRIQTMENLNRFPRFRKVGIPSSSAKAIQTFTSMKKIREKKSMRRVHTHCLCLHLSKSRIRTCDPRQNCACLFARIKCQSYSAKLSKNVGERKSLDLDCDTIISN